jgi:hypothetical protein
MSMKTQALPNKLARTQARLFAAIAFAALCSASFAQELARPRNGDHPAVVVKRLWATRAYDWTAQFYPHPAWMYLQPDALGEAPPRMAATPAADAARKEADRAAQIAAMRDAE